MPDDAADCVSARPPVSTANGIWSGNDSATWATTTPEDAGECVSERPLSGRFHQVRTPSVHGHFHQVRTPSVHGTIRPFRPRQRPSMQPTASPSARAHLLRTLKNYKVRICFGHKQKITKRTINSRPAFLSRACFSLAGSTWRARSSVTMHPYCISGIKFINTFVLHPGTWRSR